MGETGTVLLGFYDYKLVALSIVIAIMAAYVALDLVERVTITRGSVHLAWLGGGAVALGTGIWAMHYVGMEAYHLPVPVMYHWPTVLASLLTAILASWGALIIVSQPSMSPLRTFMGSLSMGGGIAAMHYIGMDAMRMTAMCNYSAPLVALSIVVAVAISWAALRLTFAARRDTSMIGWRKGGSALVLGLAIPTMHYVGLSAVSFTASPLDMSRLRNAVYVSGLELTGLVVVTVMILSLAVIISILHRQFRMQAQALEQSQLQLQTIFDNISEGIVVHDRQGNLILVNRPGSTLLGHLKQQFTIEDLTQAFEVSSDGRILSSPEDWPSARALRGDFVRGQELLIRRKDAEASMLVEVSTAPITGKTGEIDQVIISYRDVSDRRQNSETHARLAAIVNSSQDAIVGKDISGIVRSWNAAAERIFGYTADEMIGEPILRLVPPGHEDEESEFLTRIRRGETIEQLETVRRRKDGRIIHVALTISPIKDARGEVTGSSKIARDITERKQLERQLQQSQKMEAIGQLTGGVAHDFNNLLGVIVGNLDLLERVVSSNDEALKRVRTAQRAAMRGADLTRRLLTFSSTEELKPDVIDLHESIRNIAELASHALGPEFKITTRFDEAITSVFVDAAGLENALLNLAVNARDAMPRGGTVTLTTRLREMENQDPAVKTGELAPGTYACVSVTDTGCGMSRETMDRAFEPFFTTKGRSKGTGLGLAMVYGFAKQSGGLVRLYSEVGYGTTVTLYLPLTEELPQVTIPVIRDEHWERMSGTVLVVDDEADLLELAVLFLQEMGCRTLQAPDAKAALRIVEAESGIDLIVTDVIMPGGMNGVELVGQVRQLIPAVKVIYSSGFSEDALTERSGTPMDGFLLRKPFQRSEFNDLVRRVLAGSNTA